MLPLLIATLLAGCATNAHQAAPDLAPVATPSLQADYLKSMHAVYPGEHDATIVYRATTVCAALDKGRTRAEMTNDLVGGKVNEAGARIIIRGSVAAYCPNHADVVPPQ